MASAKGVLFTGPRAAPLNVAGKRNAGCYYCFFIVNTLTPAPVYADAALTVPLSQPPGASINPAGFGTQSAADGRFPPIYLDPNVVYLVELFDTGGNQIEFTSPYIPPGLPNANNIAALLFPRTSAETNAAVTPTNYAYQPGDLRRYGGVGDNKTPNDTAISSDNLQGAQLNGSPIIVLSGVYRLTKLATVGFQGILSDGSGAISLDSSASLSMSGSIFTPRPGNFLAGAGAANIFNFGPWRISVSAAGQHQVYEPAWSVVAQANLGTYSTGTFTCAWVGFASGMANVTIKYTRVGNMVMLLLPTQTGVSNSATFNMTGLPAALQPATAFNQIVAAAFLVDNGVNVLAQAAIGPPGGTILFTTATGGGFNAGAVAKGFAGNVALCYSIA